MRLVEERTLIIIEIILLIGIGLMSIFIQIGNDKIDSYQTEIIHIDNSLSNHQIQKSYWNAHKLETMITLGFSEMDLIVLPIVNESLFQRDNIDEEYKQINKNYQEGKISFRDYSQQLTNYYNKKIRYHIDSYNDGVDYLNELIISGPKCLGEINCNKLVSILYIFEIIFIILSLFGYLYLIKKIHNRTKK